LVVKRDPTLASSQQYCVLPPRVSGCNPTLFARLSVSADGADGSELEAGVCAAVGAVVGAVAGALAAGAGVAPEGCCAEHGSAADRTAQIKMESVENFTMLLPTFDEKSRRTRMPRVITAQFLILYA
jgi:hypothetical protein